MDEVATKITEILKKHMKEPRDDISLDTALTDLKIESLDMVHLQVKKDLGQSPFRCVFGAALQTGRIDLEATFDPTFATPVHLKLASSGIELGRSMWGSFIVTFCSSAR